MALSGTLYTNVGSHRRLSIEWSATQNVSNNQSTVTFKMYWEALDNYGAVESSATKDGAIITDDTTWTFSGAGLASLSPGQKKLLATRSKTITHDAEGKASFALDGFFDAEVTLDGSYYGRIALKATRYYLNDIPRASTLSSDANWSAGSSKSISITRASSSFTHLVRFFVRDVLIKVVSPVATSATVSFTLSENTEIFKALAQDASGGTRIEVVTYNNGDYIGTTTKTGTVSAPVQSKTSWGGNFTIGNDLVGSITTEHPDFTHTIQLIFGGTTYTLYDKTTQIDWAYDTDAIAESLYAKIPNDRSITGEIRIYTYYNGIQVRSYNYSAVTATVSTQWSPITSAANIRYEDINPVTLGVTANNQQIIQNRSLLRVFIDAIGTAQKGASISHYELTVNGVTRTSSSTGYITFNEINAATNVSMNFTVYDSRGLSTTITKPITILAYTPPIVNIKAERANGFESSTTITVSGKIAPLDGKNTVKLATVSYYNRNTGVTSSSTNLTLRNLPNFTADPVVYNLNNAHTFTITVKFQDAVTDTASTYSVLVRAGKPILFIDGDKSSVGVNGFPTNNNEFYVEGTMRFGYVRTWAVGGGNAAGALDMFNSDISGIHALVFDNSAGSNTAEGLLFPKSSAPADSTRLSDYDNLYMRDGVLYTSGDGGITTPSLDVQGAASANTVTTKQITLNSNGSNFLNFYGTDHGYMQFFMKGTTTRSGFFGYGSSINNTLTLANQIGNLLLTAPSTSASVDIALNGSDPVLSVGWVNANYGLMSPSTYARYNSNTSAGSPVYISSGGVLFRTASASKYKVNVQEVEKDIAERILYIDPKSWHDKGSLEEYSEYLTRLHNGESVEGFNPSVITRAYGLIAEDLEDVGLGMYVTYGEPDENGNREVEGLQYERLWTLLIPVVKDLKSRVETLEKKLGA